MGSSTVNSRQSAASKCQITQVQLQKVLCYIIGIPRVLPGWNGQGELLEGLSGEEGGVFNARYISRVMGG